MRVFLDLKLHDIPNPCSTSVRRLSTRGHDLTSHTSSGAPAPRRQLHRPSSSASRADEPRRRGSRRSVRHGTLDDRDALARLALNQPARVVASPLGSGDSLCVGDAYDRIARVRPAAACRDQKRTLTPLEAIVARATTLVAAHQKKRTARSGGSDHREVGSRFLDVVGLTRCGGGLQPPIPAQAGPTWGASAPAARRRFEQFCPGVEKIRCVRPASGAGASWPPPPEEVLAAAVLSRFTVMRHCGPDARRDSLRGILDAGVPIDAPSRNNSRSRCAGRRDPSFGRPPPQLSELFRQFDPSVHDPLPPYNADLSRSRPTRSIRRAGLTSLLGHHIDTSRRCGFRTSYRGTGNRASIAIGAR